MYVTRRLSMYLKDEAAATVPPPEGPNSSVLVISDEEAESGFGLRRDDKIRNLPLPQNKDLTIIATDETTIRIMFIPVLNQPLSTNRYYVIFTQGWVEGKAAKSSKEADKITCCWGSCIQDTAPSELDPFNVYQQFEIIKKPNRDRFEAKSVAEDGFPPMFLRGEWRLCNNIPHHHLSEQAFGLDSSLRSQLPDFDFSSSLDRSQQVLVGKWYCPAILVQEHGIKRSSKGMSNNKTMFYEMTLEQRWEKVFSKENNNVGNTVEKEIVIEVEVVNTESVKIVGTKAASWSDKDVKETGLMWFTTHDGNNNKNKNKKKKEEKVGLNMAIIERMKGEQERVGWVGGNQKIQSVVKEFGDNSDNSGMWRKFSCYVLVESFVLKTMEANLVITFDYKHAHRFRYKWD